MAQSELVGPRGLLQELGGLRGEAVEDDQETRWLRFHDSIHKAQRDNNHPTETLKFIAIALSALGEVLQEAMRRSRRRE